MKKISFIVALFGCALIGHAQQDWMSFPPISKDTTQTSTILDYTAPDGEVILHQDSRIEQLEKFVRSGEESLEGVKIDGYRVMIYFDQDKSKSEQQKAHFISLYDEHKAYVDYVAPNYRVRVGNFRTRLEAEKLKQEILAIFPTAIVIEDKIQLPYVEGSSANHPGQNNTNNTTPDNSNK